MKLKKGDTVMMLSGKDKGKQGKISKSFPKDKKVIVEHLNLITRHQKPRRQGEKGQKILVPRTVPMSKVMLVCPKCSRPTRVGYRIEGGTKERLCKKCKRAI